MNYLSSDAQCWLQGLAHSIAQWSPPKIPLERALKMETKIVSRLPVSRLAYKHFRSFHSTLMRSKKWSKMKNQLFFNQEGKWGQRANHSCQNWRDKTGGYKEPQIYQNRTHQRETAMGCREPAQEIPPMKRSWGRDLTGMADQDLRDSLDLLEHLPQNQSLSVYCLLYYVSHQHFWH